MQRIARASGEALQATVGDYFKVNKAAAKALDLHITLADKLNLVLFALVVVLVLFAVLLPKLAKPVGTVGAIVIAVLALMVIGLVAQTGEQGARTLWNPDGKQDYSVR